MQEMAREQKSLLFFPASAPDSSPDIASPLQQQLLSPCMAVEGPGHTKSSTPLEFSCWDITPCSLAALKQLPAKLYPACPQLQGSEQHLLSQPQTSAPSMGQGKVGSSKITRNQQEREVFRVDVMLSPSQGLGITQELQGCGFGEVHGIIPSGSCCWRSLQSRNLLPLVGFGAGHSRKGWHSLAGWKRGWEMSPWSSGSFCSSTEQGQTPGTGSPGLPDSFWQPQINPAPSWAPVLALQSSQLLLTRHFIAFIVSGPDSSRIYLCSSCLTNSTHGQCRARSQG